MDLGAHVNEVYPLYGCPESAYKDGANQGKLLRQDWLSTITDRDFEHIFQTAAKTHNQGSSIMKLLEQLTTDILVNPGSEAEVLANHLLDQATLSM